MPHLSELKTWVSARGIWNRLSSSNGETLMHSENYKSKDNARRGRIAVLNAVIQILGRMGYGVYHSASGELVTEVREEDVE